MSLKIKRIKDLFFRFLQDGPYANTLTAAQAADALHRQDYITLIPHHDGQSFEHYTDTPKLTSALHETNAADVIEACFAQYISDQGLDV